MCAGLWLSGRCQRGGGRSQRLGFLYLRLSIPWRLGDGDTKDGEPLATSVARAGRRGCRVLTG